VKAAFAKGLITEWYPHAVQVQPAAVLQDIDLNHLPSDGSVTWSSVAVSPNLRLKFPRDSGQTRYYAARETAAAPLRVKTAAGDEVEKFLFYRGVSAAPLPISAKQSSGGKLVIKSLSKARIPAAILFERRGERVGIDYERWELPKAVEEHASSEEVFAIYGDQIKKLKERRGYVMADVIDVTPETPNLDIMLAKFSREHWHDEDEVRFILRGRGLFHIHPREGQLAAVEVESGDLIRVPRGTWHWFDLCGDRTIRAIRLFQNQSGWTPHYTESGLDRNY